jgi:hypothetical protein
LSSGSQSQFWIQFATCKRNAIYINRYHAKVERTDRWISMVSAIASSSAIAGWALWKELSFAWAVVIAISQVLAAIKPFLPYKALLKALSQLGPELEGLALAAEEEWFAVSHGMLTEQEIHKITMSSKTKCQQATHRAFKGMSLPEDAAIEATAERDAAAYMTTIMGDDDEQS